MAVLHSFFFTDNPKRLFLKLEKSYASSFLPVSWFILYGSVTCHIVLMVGSTPSHVPGALCWALCWGGWGHGARLQHQEKVISLSCFSVSWVFLPSEDPEIGNVGGLTTNEVCALVIWLVDCAPQVALGLKEMKVVVCRNIILWVRKIVPIILIKFAAFLVNLKHRVSF